jgi:hypothetical protein
MTLSIMLSSSLDIDFLSVEDWSMYTILSLTLKILDSKALHKNDMVS